MACIVRRIDELLLHVLLGALETIRHLGSGNPSRGTDRPQRPRGSSAAMCRNHRHCFAARPRAAAATRSIAGLPGACKSVVTMPFKRSGQRWCEAGLAPCLSLRALYLSERLQPCFVRLQAARFATLAAA
jgi:hypothetical protein